MSFGPNSVTCLDHVISAEGVSVGTDRIQAIQKLKTPKSLKGLRFILGVLNFVRRFMPNFAEVTAPLVALTRKDMTPQVNSGKRGDRHKMPR